MERLARDLDETVHLSVLQGDGIVIIDKVDCDNPVRVDTFVGLRAPLHCSATGKAILAFVEPLMVLRLLPQRLPRHTPATICDRLALQRELSRVRRQGWAVNREEWRPGVCAAAVPVRDADFAVVAALSVTVPTSRFAEDVVQDRLVPALKSAAEAISREVARRGR
jgi:DNA-binding IclR family transcriptional regulator